MDPMTENTRAHLLRHYQSYPLLQAEDILSSETVGRTSIHTE
jgi:hypothetical protein